VDLKVSRVKDPQLFAQTRDREKSRRSAVSVAISRVNASTVRDGVELLHLAKN
jgi:hypothetical protein